MASSREPLLKSDDEEEEELVFDRTGLLNHHNNHIRLSDVRHRSHSSGARLLLARTINLCFAFFALGLCFALPTATLDDLQKAVHADASTIEYIYTARYSGYVLGALLGGLLFDRYNRQFLLFLSLLCTAIGVIIMPFCTVIGTLMACTAITGITMGFLDTGGNVWCLDLWGKKSAPIMQALHFFFALGAFVAPLVAEPFLSPHPQSLSNQVANNTVTNKLFGLSFNHGPPRPEIGRHALNKRALSEFQQSHINTLLDANFSYESISSSPVATSFHTTKIVSLFNNTVDEHLQPTLPIKEKTFFINSTSSLKQLVKPKKPQILDGNLLNHDDTWSRPSHRNKPKLPQPIIDEKTLPSSNDSLINATSTSVFSMLSLKTEIESSNDSLSKPYSSLKEYDLKTETTSLAFEFSSKNDSYFYTPPDFETTKTPISYLSSSPMTTSLLSSLTYSLRMFELNNSNVETTSLSDDAINGLTLNLNQSFMLKATSPSFHDAPSLEISASKSFLPQQTSLLTLISNSITLKEETNLQSSKESLLPSFYSTNFPTSTLDPKVFIVKANNSSSTLSEMSSPAFSTPNTISSSPTPALTILKSTSNANDATLYFNENPPPLNEKENEESIDESIIDMLKTTPSINVTEVPLEILNSTNKDVFANFFEAMHKHRLGKFEFAYVILSLYLFSISLVFLVFLCLNPREGRSRQEENLDKSHFITTSFKISTVILMSLFLCLYVGIQVAVGQLLITFATAQEIKLSKPTGYFLTYIFWGSFALSRAVSIFIASRVNSIRLLVGSLVVCLIASLMLVAGANKIEALLWIGIIILAMGMAPIFPLSLSWVEHYIPVTNKAASFFILGAALGEMAIPLVIEHFINQEPMVLMYMNIGVNLLCSVTFAALWLLATRQGSKYKTKPNRTLYQLANASEDIDMDVVSNKAENHWPNLNDSALLLTKKRNVRIISDA